MNVHLYFQNASYILQMYAFLSSVPKLEFGNVVFYMIQQKGSNEKCQGVHALRQSYGLTKKFRKVVSPFQ